VDSKGKHLPPRRTSAGKPQWMGIAAAPPLPVQAYVCHEMRADVRVGSSADISGLPEQSRSTPESGHRAFMSARPKAPTRSP
jgi:hypothetical protein